MGSRCVGMCDRDNARDGEAGSISIVSPFINAPRISLGLRAPKSGMRITGRRYAWPVTADLSGRAVIPQAGRHIEAGHGQGSADVGDELDEIGLPARPGLGIDAIEMGL